MNNKELYMEERKAGILAILESAGRVQVPELVEEFGVSGTTIRNDLRELEQAGMLIRTHGGAIKIEQRGFEDRPRDRAITEEKARMAQYALIHIEDGDSIAIDTGTSCVAFAEELCKSKLHNLKILTNDLKIALMLSEDNGHQVYFLGGKVRNGYHYTTGEDSMVDLSGYSVDKSIIATNSFSLERGYSTPNAALGHLKAQLFAICKKSIVLCGSEKFGKESFKVFAKPDAADVLITDDKVKPEDMDGMKRKGIRFTIAS